MCNNNNNNNDCQCISEVLTVICILQQNASCSDNCLDTCDRGFLGCSTGSVVCNTRPIILYGCCGNGVAPISMPTTKADIVCTDEEETCSRVFRVEKVDGCCATFRVLAPNPEIGGFPYVATNSFFTLNLNCCCAIRCLQDTYVECI